MSLDIIKNAIICGSANFCFHPTHLVDVCMRVAKTLLDFQSYCNGYDFKFKTVTAIINKVCTADLQIVGPRTSFIQTRYAVKGDN